MYQQKASQKDIIWVFHFETEERYSTISLCWLSNLLQLGIPAVLIMIVYGKRGLVWELIHLILILGVWRTDLLLNRLF